MKKRYVGRRGTHSTDWVWEEPTVPQPRRARLPGPWLLALLAAALVALAAGIAAIAIIRTGGGPEGYPAVTPTPAATGAPTLRPSPQPTPPVTPSGTITSSPTASPSPAASPTAPPPSPTASPAAAPSGILLAWSKASRAWDASGTAGHGYREGEAVPLLLIVRGTKPSQQYAVHLYYDCSSGGANAIDFLTGVPEAALEEITGAAGGPGRARPDAAIPLPDDAAVTFDDARPDASLRLWGGTFASAPQPPSPPGQCAQGKTVNVAIVARQETVYLLWGAHLASAKDWGEGKGASSATAPFSAGAGGGGPSVYVAFIGKDLEP